MNGYNRILTFNASWQEAREDHSSHDLTQKNRRQRMSSRRSWLTPSNSSPHWTQVGLNKVVIAIHKMWCCNNEIYSGLKFTFC